MKRIFTTDWVEYIFNRIALWIYENEQKKYRKSIQSQKRKIINNNRIIVKVNNEVIYDSKKQKDMSDDLYYALLSYNLMEVINSMDRNKKAPINYNITPSISVLPDLITEKVS